MTFADDRRDKLFSDTPTGILRRKVSAVLTASGSAIAKNTIQPNFFAETLSRHFQ